VTDLPPGWVETTLGEAASWGSGGTPKAGDARYYGGGIPWAVIGDLNDAVVYATAKSITEAGLAEFGSAPALSPMPALYYDAASLLIHRLWQVSRIVNGNLLINRAALASAVRNTTNYWGVTCTITLDPASGNRLNDPASLQRCAS